MGHDIYGAKDRATYDSAWDSNNREDWPCNRSDEFPYLRYNMSNPRSHAIYDALGCPDLDGGVSGVGEGREFTFDQVQAAESILKETRRDQPDWVQEQEGRFFGLLLGFSNANGTCYVSFG
jgi:hypothetical protein